MLNIRPKHKINDNPDFSKDIRDFFSGRKSGHIGTWRYSEPLYKGDIVNGMYHWGQFIKNAQSHGVYYIFNDEVNVIKKFAPKIQSLLPEILTLIDMGPGSKEAVLEKIGPLFKTGQISSYVAVDVVKECVERTNKIIADNFPDISFFGMAEDFYQETLKIPVSGMPVMLMFGQTLFNLPIHPLDKILPTSIVVDRLLRFRSHLRFGGYLLVAQDINQNGDDLVNAYAGEKEFAENLLYRIQRDLPVSDEFDPAQFSFEPCWVPETGALAHSYICKQDMSFSVSGESFFFKKNKRLYLHNTYKFPVDAFLNMAQNARFDVVHTEFSDSERMALHLLKAA